MNDLNFYYLAGLVSSDGYIDYPESSTKRKSYYCCIGLSSKDEEILYNIQKVFKGKIAKRSGIGSFNNKEVHTTIWSTCDKELIKQLQNTGLTNNKTYTLNVTDWFNNLKYEQKCAYIRGCWDGDGTINFNKTTNNKNLYMCVTSICSASYKFIKMIEAFFDQKGTLYTREISANIKATVPLYYYYLNSRSALLLEQLYRHLNTTSNCLFLQRKYDNFLKVKSYYTNVHQPRYTHSQLHGPKWNKTIKKWGSSIISQGKWFNLGIYKYEKNAAIAYDVAKFVINNTKTKYNFPELINEYQSLKVPLKDLNYIKMPKVVQSISKSKKETIKTPTSIYRGLYKIRTCNRWTVTVYCNGKGYVYPKTYNSEIKAALKYDHYAYMLKQKKAKLNFPNRIQKYQKLYS